MMLTSIAVESKHRRLSCPEVQVGRPRLHQTPEEPLHRLPLDPEILLAAGRSRRCCCWLTRRRVYPVEPRRAVRHIHLDGAAGATVLEPHRA
jgi:hypothetical protein